MLFFTWGILKAVFVILEIRLVLVNNEANSYKATYTPKPLGNSIHVNVTTFLGELLKDFGGGCIILY